MNTDHDKTVLSEVKASGGVKLGSVRYVLVISLILAGLVGMIIWNIFSKGV
jgi:hypothetical protein